MTNNDKATERPDWSAWLDVIERGYEKWADKPHNGKWRKRLAGTPIANDLKVCIAVEVLTELLKPTALNNYSELEEIVGELGKLLIAAEPNLAGWWCKECRDEVTATFQERCDVCGHDLHDVDESEWQEARRQALSRLQQFNERNKG